VAREIRTFDKNSQILFFTSSPAKIELESMRHIQQNAANYRHDMRHHLALLQGMASKGHINEIVGYLQTAQADIDSITPPAFVKMRP
jgi:hypothetical protein